MEIYTASIWTLAATDYSPEQLAAWAPVPPDSARWEERLARLNTIVAESDGVLAGFTAYTQEGYLDFLFTHPAFARRGVASRLCQCVETALGRAGVPVITTRASLVSRPFFQRRGFLLDGEESIECRGVFLRWFAMHKPLGE